MAKVKKTIDRVKLWDSFFKIKSSQEVKPQIISKDTYLESVQNMNVEHPECKVIKEATKEEAEIVQLVIEPKKIICPDCGGITLEGLQFCHKCGGELDINL